MSFKIFTEHVFATAFIATLKELAPDLLIRKDV